MTLAQHIMRARENANAIVTSLDFVLRSLLESLDLEEEDAAPSTPKAPRNSEAPTTFNPRWDSIAFEKHILTLHKQAKTVQDVENVRALLERGVTGALLTVAEADALRAKLK